MLLITALNLMSAAGALLFAVYVGVTAPRASVRRIAGGQVAMLALYVQVYTRRAFGSDGVRDDSWLAEIGVAAAPLVFLLAFGYQLWFINSHARREEAEAVETLAALHGTPGWGDDKC